MKTQLTAMGLMLGILALMSPADANEAPAPPRIGVRKPAGQSAEFFVVGSGQPFIPRGFNHTVLDQWHATFNAGIYSGEVMEETLARMQALGANTIRVWIWGQQDAHGYTGRPDSKGLNPEYMANVLDFLRRASRHRIHVLAVMDETPHNAEYDAIVERETGGNMLPAVTGYNRQYMTPGVIAAKCAAARDFVLHIRKQAPELLSAVLGWSLANEVFVLSDQGPFSLSEGLVEGMGGKQYDMASPAQRQACYDDAIVHCANAFAAAVKEADPDALVTAGMWTADAHGRPAFNGVPRDGKDARICPRPSVLAGTESQLDFLDIHVYPWDGTSAVRSEAHEAQAVSAGSKAVLTGETGVFKDKTPEQARIMLREMVAQSYALGYDGHLMWAWDLSMVPGQTWSAVEEGLGGFVMGLVPEVCKP